MKLSFVTSIVVLTLALFIQAPLASADLGGTANGSSCDLNGTGSGGGVIYNGQCLSPSSYPTQSGVTGTSGGGTTLINPLNAGTSLESFLNGILAFIIRIGTIVVILMLVFVGYKFVAARGNDSELIEARQMLLWTLIGGLVLLGAQAISAGILATVQSLGG